MCGILLAKRMDNRSVVKSLLKRFEHQKNRGTQGFGYIVIKNGVISDIKRAKYEHFIKKFLDADSGSHEILFHHRMPTSTENLEEVTHPIIVNNEILDYDYFVIHNGVLSNEDELKTEYEGMGFKYTTDIKKKTTMEIGGKVVSEEETIGFNDSESFAIDLALYLDGKKNTIDSRGSIAFICYQAYKDGRVKSIHYGRNSGNPLIVEDNNDVFFLKSTGSGKEIEEDTLYTIDYPTWQTTNKKVPIGSRYIAGFGNNNYWQRNLLPSAEEYTKQNDDTPQLNDTGYAREYEQQNLTQKRYDDILDEIIEINKDIDFCQNELNSPKTANDPEYKIMLIDEIREKTKKKKSLEEEYDYLDMFFGSGGDPKTIEYT